MNIKTAKLIAKVNPKIIFNLNKEQVDDEIISLAVKKRLSPKDDKNNILISNINYIVKACNEGISSIVIPFIKSNLFKPEEIDIILKQLSSNDLLSLIRLDKGFLSFLKESEVTKELSFKNSLLFILTDDELEIMPDFIKKDNLYFLNRYMSGNLFLPNINKLLELNPNHKSKIIESAYNKVVANNDFQYIFNFTEDFVNMAIARMNEETKKNLFDYLTSTNVTLEPFAILYENSNEFKATYLLQNPAKLNSETISPLLSEEKKEVVSNIILNHLETQKENIDVYLVIYTYSYTSYEVQEKTLASLFELLLAGKTDSSILSFKPFMEKYFDEILEKKPDLLLEPFKKHENIKDEKTAFIIYIQAQYKKKIYEYIKRNDDFQKYNKTYFSSILENNFNINTFPEEGELKYNFDLESKDKIIKLLREIKETNKNVSILLVTKDEYVPLLKDLKDILPGKISITFENSFEGNYSIEDIISKDQTLQYYADSILSQKDKDGNIKVLSPYEKYIAAYKIATHFSHYIEGSDISESRALYRIINAKDQKIVCVGYARLLLELLKRVGLTECMYWEVLASEEERKIEQPVFDTKKANHARVLVHIKDDKYGIDNIFMADPTWDSIDEPLKGPDGMSQSMKDKFKYAHIDIATLTNPDDGSNYYVDRLSPSSSSFWEIVQKLDINDSEHAKNNGTVEEYAQQKITSSIPEDKLIQALLVIDKYVDRNQSPSSLSLTGISQYDFNRKACEMGKIQLLINHQKEIDEAEQKPYSSLFSDDYGSFESFIRYNIENKMSAQINNSLTSEIFQIMISRGKIEIIFNTKIFSSGKYSDDELEKKLIQLKQFLAASGLSCKEGYNNNLVIADGIIDISKPLSESYDNILNIVKIINASTIDKENEPFSK